MHAFGIFRKFCPPSNVQNTPNLPVRTSSENNHFHVFILGKPVITSLLISSGKELNKPEISDIAGAVIDGSDAFLLPQRNISTNLLQSIDTVCREAEAAVHHKTKFVELKDNLPMPMESVYSLAISAVETAFKSNAAAIICLTASGRTAKVLAR